MASPVRLCRFEGIHRDRRRNAVGSELAHWATKRDDQLTRREAYGDAHRVGLAQEARGLHKQPGLSSNSAWRRLNRERDQAHSVIGPDRKRAVRGVDDGNI